MDTATYETCMLENGGFKIQDAEFTKCKFMVVANDRRLEVPPSLNRPSLQNFLTSAAILGSFGKTGWAKVSTKKLKDAKQPPFESILMSLYTRYSSSC